MTDAEEILIAKMQAIADCPIRGHLKRIDDTRLAFLGQNPEDPDTWYLGFRNHKGEDTLLSLTPEGYEALKWLCNEKFKGERVPYPYVLTTEWVVTMQEEPTKEPPHDQ